MARKIRRQITITVFSVAAMVWLLIHEGSPNIIDVAVQGWFWIGVALTSAYALLEVHFIMLDILPDVKERVSKPS